MCNYYYVKPSKSTGSKWTGTQNCVEVLSAVQLLRCTINQAGNETIYNQHNYHRIEKVIPQNNCT